MFIDDGDQGAGPLPPTTAPPPRVPWERPGLMTVRGHNGTVTLDEDFVSISRTGFFARTTVGKGEKRIPIASITAVQWKPAGATLGFVQFTIAGSNERRSRFGRQSQTALQDENSVTFQVWHSRDFQKLREAVERAIARRENRPRSEPAQLAPDPMTQLKQLAELRDASVITDAEFEVKKAELLRRI